MCRDDVKLAQLLNNICTLRGIDSSSYLGLVCVEDVCNSLREETCSPESTVRDVDVDSQAVLSTGLVRNTNRLVATLECFNAWTEVKALLALCEEVALDGSKLLGWRLAHKMIREGNGLQTLVVKVTASLKVCIEHVEADWGGALDDHAVLVFFAARSDYTALLFIEIDVDAQLSLDALCRPRKLVTVEEPALLEVLLDSLGIPELLDQATLFSTAADENLSNY